MKSISKNYHPQDITAQTTGTKVGKYTKYQREKRGYSLNEFANKIEVTTSFLLRLERGTYQNISFNMIEKLAKGFDMSIEDFLYKCKITHSTAALPPLDYYLKEVYQFPEEAVDDVKLFIQFTKTKYKDKITELKMKHKEYWEEE